MPCHGVVAALSVTSRVVAGLFCGVFLWGCAVTTIPPQQPPSGIFRLASANDRVLPFTVSTPTTFDTVGHQYLLFGLPFGQIRVSDPPADLRAATFQALATRGYRPIDVTEVPARPERHLKISMDDVQLSAYDVFFFRIPYCRMRLTVLLVDEEGRNTKHATGEFADYTMRALAFTRELQPLYNDTLEDGVTSLLTELSL